MNGKTKAVALCGMLAAVVLVIMCMGGLIPLSTYVCPILCALVQFVVLCLCGKRLAWCWYAAVAILCLMFGPDKESAAVFALLGYYPMLKPVFERWPLSWLWKFLLFNTTMILLYGFLLHLLGLENIAQEFSGFGVAGMILLLVLGNVTFLLLDKLLSMAQMKWGSGRRG